MVVKEAEYRTCLLLSWSGDEMEQFLALYVTDAHVWDKDMLA
jgi:hypothetical protein